MAVWASRHGNFDLSSPAFDDPHQKIRQTHPSLPWGRKLRYGPPPTPPHIYDSSFLLKAAMGILYSARFSRWGVARSAVRMNRGSLQISNPMKKGGRLASTECRLKACLLPNGLLFRTFMLTYLCIDFLVEFETPVSSLNHLGLSAIQLGHVLLPGRRFVRSRIRRCYRAPHSSARGKTFRPKLISQWKLQNPHPDPFDHLAKTPSASETWARRDARQTPPPPRRRPLLFSRGYERELALLPSTL